MNRLHHKLRKARRESRYLRGLVKLRKGGLMFIDPSIEELSAKMEGEVRYLDAISESIRKGYKRVKE